MDVPTPTKAWSATRAALAAAMAEIDGVLPGSIVVRHIPCGKAECACKSDPDARHGPYIQWTRSVGGRTITRYLTQEQMERYRPWFDNARRLEDLTAKLEVASLQAFESTERPSRTKAAPANPARTRAQSRRRSDR